MLQLVGLARGAHRGSGTWTQEAKEYSRHNLSCLRRLWDTSVLSDGPCCSCCTDTALAECAKRAVVVDVLLTLHEAPAAQAGGRLAGVEFAIGRGCGHRTSNSGST